MKKCGVCGAVEELRPYGKDRSLICFDCAMRPENKKETERQFEAVLDSSPVVILTDAGPIVP